MLFDSFTKRARGEVYTWGCNDDEALGRAIPDAKSRICALYEKHAPMKLAEGDAAIDALLAKYDRYEDLLFLRLAKKYGAYPGGECVPGLVLGVLSGLRIIQVSFFSPSDIQYSTFPFSPFDSPALKHLHGHVILVQVECGDSHTAALSADGTLRTHILPLLHFVRILLIIIIWLAPPLLPSLDSHRARLRLGDVP